MYRSFLAIFPPKEVRDAIRDYKRFFAKEARNFNFITIDQLHITLQFLGESVSENSIELIKQTLPSYLSNVKPFTIDFGKLHYGFHTQQNPSVLYADVIREQQLLDTTTLVHRVVQTLNLEDIKPTKDHAKLIHHLTIARLKRTPNKRYRQTIDEIIANISKSGARIPSFQAESITLMQSVIQASGSKYLKLAEFALHK